MKRKATIVFLCTTRALGGIELNVLRLARWMSERDWNCIVAGVDGAPILDAAAEAGLEIFSVGKPLRYGPVASAWKLSSRIRALGAHVLWANATRDINLAVLTKRLNRGLLVFYTQHMQIGVEKRDAFHSWEYSHLDAWIAPLSWLARQATDMTVMPSGRIHVIPLGIDLSDFQSPPGRIEARAALDLPAEAKVVGVVGRLDRGKGQEYLLEAIHLLQHEGRHVHALVIGEETRDEQQHYGQFLRRRVAELGISERVHFRDFQKDIQQAYAAMDIFTLTSLAETYGMVTIEAMAAGLPVIGTDTAGTPNLITHNKTGILVPPADARRLTDSIRHLLDHPETARQISTDAKLEATQRFSHETQVSLSEALIERLSS